MGLTILFTVLGFVILGLLCRFAPGFKCISFCKYKTYKKKRATKKLKKICEIEEILDTFSKYHHVIITKSINTDGYTAKELLTLYNNISYFNCSYFKEEEWVPSAREILKERVAELQLLEA